MPLWVDKYRPRTLGELDFHPQLTSRLKKIAQAPDLPHLLFYGPSGAGKKTRISCLLKQIFGGSVEKMKVERKSFRATTAKTVEITILASNYHLEMNPSDVGNYDRVVVQEIIKELAASQGLASATSDNDRTFRIVVLNEADQLSKSAQHGLRRTMEKYVGNCRLVLCCESLSKVIEPVRSRCLAVRVPAPEEPTIMQCVRAVCQREAVDVSDGFLSNVAMFSKRNLRRALLMTVSLDAPSKPR